MKLINSFVALLIVFLFYSPALAFAEYEQYFEKIHYNHIDRTATQPSLESKKVFGPENSTLTVYIWGSLNESFTQKFFTEVFPSLSSIYQDTKYIFNNRTLIYHGEEAENAAKLSECLANQNQFWPNIETQIKIAKKEITVDKLEGVSQTELQKCLQKPATAALIKEKNSDADLLGIQSIPTIIIKNPNPDPNLYDLKITGAQNLEVFEEAFAQVMGEKRHSEIENNQQSTDLSLEERTASLEAELLIIKEEQSFIQNQIEKLIALIDSVLNTVEL